MKIELTVMPSVGLSLAHQENLRVTWNRRVVDPLAFVPHEGREKISPEKSLVENERLGAFAAQRLRKLLVKPDETTVMRRVAQRKKVVAGGYGRGYDSRWLQEAPLVGFQTWWIDVSDLACQWAVKSREGQFDELELPPTPWRLPRPRVIQGEISNVLEDPGAVGLHLDSVEIWYLCRTLGFLSDRGVIG